MYIFMLFKVIFNELYEFIKSRDRWRCFIIRHQYYLLACMKRFSPRSNYNNIIFVKLYTVI